jgi:hypothetical protein
MPRRRASPTTPSPEVVVEVHLSKAEHVALEAVGKLRGLTVPALLRAAALESIGYRFR